MSPFRAVPRRRPADAGADPRYRRAEEQWQAMEAMLPYMAAMHPMRPDHIHEELELQLPDFSSYQLEWVARVPGWRDYYLAHDQTPHYQYLKTVLQILQWRRPGERWVLKSPQHLEQLGPLLDGLSRRHPGGHPPRSGVGGAVGGHHDDLRGPHELPDAPIPTSTSPIGPTASVCYWKRRCGTATWCPPTGRGRALRPVHG